MQNLSPLVPRCSPMTCAHSLRWDRITVLSGVSGFWVLVVMAAVSALAK
jgi:hypothetical protein